MNYNQIITTMHLHKHRRKKVGLSTWHSKSDQFISSTVLSFSFFFLICFVCFAGEWSGHVCQRQGSLFSITLITSFLSLQIYYSTVCKGVDAITSSAVSRPVMTTGPMNFSLLTLASFRSTTCLETRLSFFGFSKQPKWPKIYFSSDDYSC